MKMMCALALSTFALTGVTAQEIGYDKDALGYTAMIEGDWQTAERQLAASSDSLSDDPAHLLNLAQVYASTGRNAEADAIYARVLAGEDMVLVLSDDRKVSAHNIASSRLARVEQASR